MTSPLVEEVVLRDDDDIPQEKRQTLSLVLVVRPGSTPTSTQDKILPVVPHVDEVVLLLSGPSRSHDPSSWTREWPWEAPTSVADLTQDACPHLYALDEERTYAEAGPPLAGEPGHPTSGETFVARWDLLLNLGQTLCSKEWCLVLRDDETLDLPQYLRSTCSSVADRGRSLVVVPHRAPGRRSLEPRIYKVPACWEGAAREAVLDPNLVVVQGGLSTASGEAHDADTFRALYLACRRKKWGVADRDLLHLARAADLSGLGPGVRSAAVDACLARSTDPEARAWASSLRGEELESRGLFERACEWYEKAIAEYPSWKSALRLSRSHFYAKNWISCVDSYRRAAETYKTDVCLLDDACLNLDTSLIYAASAMWELGWRDQCARASALIRSTFPDDPGVEKFCRSLEGARC